MAAHKKFTCGRVTKGTDAASGLTQATHLRNDLTQTLTYTLGSEAFPMFQNTRQHNAANHLTCITIHLNKKIAGSIRSNTELEVEQNEIGSGVAAIMTTYGFGLGDPVLELNINPSNDWKGLSNNDLDSLLLHKIIHEAANTDDNGTLDYNDTHFIDSLTTNLCKEPVIRSWMPRSVKDCCCPK